MAVRELWLFVLSDDAPNYYLPDPPDLGRNGSFAVFKVMWQDVAGFRSSCKHTTT